MMKKSILFLFFIVFFSCEKKMEFIESNAIPALVLVKNPIRNDSILKIQIIDFIKKRPAERIHFYRYTWNTKYFIDNEEESTGGFSQNALYDYPEDDIAVFDVHKCEQDTTKLVGELFFYGNDGLVDGRNDIDTLIYHCK